MVYKKYLTVFVFYQFVRKFQIIIVFISECNCFFFVFSSEILSAEDLLDKASTAFLSTARTLGQYTKWGGDFSNLDIEITFWCFKPLVETTVEFLFLDF